MARTIVHAHLWAAILATVSLAASTTPIQADTIGMVTTEVGERINVYFQPPPNWTRSDLKDNASYSQLDLPCVIIFGKVRQVVPESSKADKANSMWLSLLAKDGRFPSGRIWESNDRTSDGKRGWLIRRITYSNGVTKGGVAK